jgi:methylmalonyl-CoA mutase
MEDALNLKNDFPVQDFDEWKKQVEADLKGDSFEKKLISKTYEGINLQPIYTEKDIKDIPFLNNYPGFDNFLRGSTASVYHSSPWEIAQEYSYALAEDINNALKEDIERGLNSICISLDYPTLLGIDADQSKIGDVGKGGLSISGIRKMQVLFDDIDLTEIPVHIHAGYSALPFALLFASYARELRMNLMNVRGSITSDPYDFLLKYGHLPIPISKIFDEIKISTQLMIRANSPLRTIGINGYNYYNAGGNAVQELAFSFATAVDYITEMVERGLDINDVISKVKFNFGLSSFYFMEISKLRAARILWNNILKSFGVTDNVNIYIHGKTIDYNKTITDSYVNMLRVTIESFAGVIGGADAISTTPFDYFFKQPDFFSRRIARNTQIILRDESHLDHVIDPAAGSYFIENLTFDLCKSAWNLFQKVHQLGGMLEAIKSGFIQNEINKISFNRKTDYSKRKTILVGTNMYANSNEDIMKTNGINYQEVYKKRVEYIQKYRVSGVDKKHQSILDKLQKIADTKSYDLVELSIEAYIDGATIGEISRSIRSYEHIKLNVEPLNFSRASEPFEELRIASEKYKEKTGNKPKVFLAIMGNLKQYKARADFSRGFFEVAGFDVIYPSNGFINTEEAVSSAIDSNAEIVTICSTDETYPDIVPVITKGIKEKSNNTIIVLAGYPKDQIEQHKSSGIDEFLYLGGNAIEILSRLQSKIINQP